MKKALLILSIFITSLSFAQIPQGISYQAIALNGSGNPIVSSNVGIRLSVLNTTASGTVLYSETHVKTTNSNGLFNLIIGQGNITSGTFSAINWGTNPKFLKVEMDATGANNYILVGTTQLLSVPYALSAKSLVLSAGEGIMLTSPNGTQYELGVNNSGQLTLPTSNTSSNIPDMLYLFGSFNNFNQSTALLLNNLGGYFTGFKYLTSGTQIKLTSANTENAAVYGLNGSGELVLNGSAYTVPSSGFYFFYIVLPSNGGIVMYTEQFAPQLVLYNSDSGIYTYHNFTYNTATNTLSTTLNGILNSHNFVIRMPSPTSSYSNYGDFLADGTTEDNGFPISFPASNTSPKNYKINYVMNVNGTASYTITQVP